MSVSLSKRLLRPWTLVVAVATAAALLSSCSPRTKYWSPAQAPKANKVSWVTFNHSVGFERSGAVFGKAERRRLERFLAETDVGYSDRVFVTTTSARHDQQAAAVAEHLRSLRLQPKVMITKSAANGVTVVIGRYLVTPPRCPDWAKRPGLDPANRVSSNFGCATVTNLGLMVADPGDLVHGHLAGPADGEAGARFIENYRKGQVKEPVSISTSGTGGG